MPRDADHETGIEAGAEAAPPLADGGRAGPWDGYLVGPENALAHGASLAVARGEPGSSPLVVVGPAGSGKSRLLAGLAAEWMARRPGAPIAHLPAEAFADACHEAAGRDDPAAWAELRDRYRNLDLLAIDDLHALARSPLALAELAATLDALDAAGASVAASTRDAADRYAGWPPRLADRLRGGLTVRLDPPGPSTRRRYLHDRCRARGLTLAASTLDAMADAADGYRALDGRLARLALAARVERRPADAALAESLGAEAALAPPTIAAVTRLVASHFGVRPRDLRSASRRSGLVAARHLAILLARDLTGASHAALGASFGDRDPATIRHALRAAAARLDADPSLAALAAAIRRRLDPAADPR